MSKDSISSVINQKLAEIKKVVEAAGLELKNDGDAVMAVPMDKSKKEKKRKLSPSELSAIRSKASLMRKHFGGGRPKGAKKKGELAEPTKSVTIGEKSYYILKRLALNNNMSIKDYFTAVMNRLSEQFGA